MLRFAFYTLAAVVVLGGLGWAFMAGDRFLSQDNRFLLGPESSGGRQDPILITGQKNSSRAEVLKIFETDRGRSIADIDLDRRRGQIRENVEWVADAAVRRIWPNRIAVAITEAMPVAFIQAPVTLTGQYARPVSYKPMLIDQAGALLTPRGAVPQSLPLLTGVRAGDDRKHRQTRVARMIQVLDDLSAYKRRIYEVDLTNPDNVRIGFQLGGRDLTLVLGRENFLERLEVFLRHYEGIQDRIPPRAVLDISLKGRITAIPAAEEPTRR
jgi:hypothetical protein